MVLFATMTQLQTVIISLMIMVIFAEHTQDITQRLMAISIKLETFISKIHKKEDLECGMKQQNGWKLKEL